MPRYKLTIEYDGRPFVGWQRQDNGPSVQGALEKAVRGFANEEAGVHGAGRTDTGVHALAMIAHVDLSHGFQTDTIRDALNFHLKPAPIAVMAVEMVSEDFHARFSCVRRAYEYRIINRRPPLTFEAGLAWRVTQRLNAEGMDEAAQTLVGQHDFTTFRAAGCQSASPVKSIEEVSVLRKDEFVVLRCAARSFLQHQVRSIIGSLVEVGKGKWTTRDFQKALAAKDRSRCGPVAPPNGLYFMRADYETT